MRVYKVTTLTGQVLTIEAPAVTFTPGHVVFVDGEKLVRALRNQMVVEITEETKS